MNRVAVTMAVLALTGCGQPPARNEKRLAANKVIDATAPAPVRERPPAPRPTPTPAPTPHPPSLPEPKGAIEPKSAEAAAQVVQRYGALLEERHFAEARRLWGGDGAASGLSEADFVAAFDKYATIDAEVGASGPTEGAAGSIYVDVPLKLSGTLKRGGPFALVGPVTLRRVNDVDGATPAQLRWHIAQSGLKPRP